MTHDDFKAYLDSLPVDDEPLTPAGVAGLDTARVETGPLLSSDELLTALGVTRDGSPRSVV
jgi:hypothetical protein